MLSAWSKIKAPILQRLILDGIGQVAYSSSSICSLIIFIKLHRLHRASRLHPSLCIRAFFRLCSKWFTTNAFTCTHFTSFGLLNARYKPVPYYVRRRSQAWPSNGGDLYTLNVQMNDEMARAKSSLPVYRQPSTCPLMIRSHLHVKLSSESDISSDYL